MPWRPSAGCFSSESRKPGLWVIRMGIAVAEIRGTTRAPMFRRTGPTLPRSSVFPQAKPLAPRISKRLGGLGRNPGCPSVQNRRN